ncbi:MAG: TetR/AcrR family transcriptional regulator [Actinomycetota bacterium]|nr:TetR/AcrR family transcriptional regulator [Actinomycetota bacterium]MDH4017166.1 TetR/AcrR family transcriptional regulator [Actinomycetota bacterium]
MRSVDSGNPDDRTVRARVRDAAIELVAAGGVEALTARAVAERAGVSPGSVINNFGSMEGLRHACDEHVVALIRQRKSAAMAAGTSFDLVGSLREAEMGPLSAYLAAVMAEDSPAVAKLVDELVADAVAYSDTGVQTGMLRPTDDPRGRAVILTLSGLGTLVMHRHLSRLLGVDLTASGAGPESLAAYIRPLYEFYAGGLFTEEFSARATAALGDLATGQPGAPPDPIAGPGVGPNQGASAIRPDSTEESDTDAGTAGPGGNND